MISSSPIEHRARSPIGFVISEWCIGCLTNRVAIVILTGAAPVTPFRTCVSFVGLLLLRTRRRLLRGSPSRLRGQIRHHPTPGARRSSSSPDWVPRLLAELEARVKHPGQEALHTCL